MRSSSGRRLIDRRRQLGAHTHTHTPGCSRVQTKAACSLISACARDARNYANASRSHGSSTSSEPHRRRQAGKRRAGKRVDCSHRSIDWRRRRALLQFVCRDLIVPLALSTTAQKCARERRRQRLIGPAAGELVARATEPN